MKQFNRGALALVGIVFLGACSGMKSPVAPSFEAQASGLSFAAQASGSPTNLPVHGMPKTVRMHSTIVQPAPDGSCSFDVPVDDQGYIVDLSACSKPVAAANWGPAIVFVTPDTSTPTTSGTPVAAGSTASFSFSSTIALICNAGTTATVTLSTTGRL